MTFMTPMTLTFMLIPILICGPAAPQERDLEKLISAGEQYYESRRFPEALQAFETALGIAPEGRQLEVRRYLAAVLAALGLERVNAGENKLAEETFRRALKYTEEYYARLGLGYLYYLQLKDAEALSELQAALKLEQAVRRQRDRGRVPKLLAILEYRQGRMREAIDRLEESARLDPGDREAAALLARWRVEASTTRSFEEIPSERFRFRADPEVGSALRRRAVKEMYRAYEEIGNELGLWPRRRVPVVLYSVKNFHLATGAYHWVGGMFDGQLKLPVPAGPSAGDKDPGTLRRTIRHEYAHVLIRQIAPECPVWLNEGLAQYFERKATRQEVERALYRHRSRRLPLAKIPARLWEVDDEKLARQSYLQGLGFVEYLAHRFHAFRLRLLLRAMTEEHSVGRAFERVYGATLEVLEDDWWRGIEESGGKEEGDR
jgi:tetratricopeptide (TPR) repeat protein